MYILLTWCTVAFWQICELLLRLLLPNFPELSSCWWATAEEEADAVPAAPEDPPAQLLLPMLLLPRTIISLSSQSDEGGLSSFPPLNVRYLAVQLFVPICKSRINGQNLITFYLVKTKYRVQIHTTCVSRLWKTPPYHPPPPLFPLFVHLHSTLELFCLNIPTATLHLQLLRLNPAEIFVFANKTFCTVLHNVQSTASLSPLPPVFTPNMANKD